MKQMIRFFSMGMMVSTLLLAVYYYLFAEDKTASVAESSLFSEEEMIDQLEKSGYTVMAVTASTESEKQVNTVQPILQQEEGDKAVTINITKGMNLSDIGKKLKEKNIIEDEEAFTYYMDAKGDSTKIKIGSFKLKKEMNYKEIAKVITGK